MPILALGARDSLNLPCIDAYVFSFSAPRLSMRRCRERENESHDNDMVLNVSDDWPVESYESLTTSFDAFVESTKIYLTMYIK